MNREIRFDCLITDNKEKLSHRFSEWLDGDGWKHDFYAPLVTNGTFHHEELGDGWFGEIIRRQFTGLLDNKKNRIYEGDLLMYPIVSEWDKENFTAFEVFSHEGDANSDYNIGFSINRTHYHGAVCGGFIPSFKPKEVSKMIVIGNIYSNPELLK